MDGNESREPRLSRAIAYIVDIALGAEPLGIDFFGGHVLAFTIGSGFIKPATFNEFLIALLRIGALLVPGLRDVLIDGPLVVQILARGRGRSDSGRRR